jgi:hypothetical protein
MIWSKSIETLLELTCTATLAEDDAAAEPWMMNPCSVVACVMPLAVTAGAPPGGATSSD